MSSAEVRRAPIEVLTDQEITQGVLRIIETQVQAGAYFSGFRLYKLESENVEEGTYNYPFYYTDLTYGHGGKKPVRPFIFGIDTRTGHWRITEVWSPVDSRTFRQKDDGTISVTYNELTSDDNGYITDSTNSLRDEEEREDLTALLSSNLVTEKHLQSLIRPKKSKAKKLGKRALA